MKRIIPFNLVVVLLLAIAQAAFAITPAPSGHLIIKRSVTLGRNLSITIKIDGKLAGLLSWHRTFETTLTPGRHVVTAEPSEFGEIYHLTLDVRPQQTYSYTAHYNAHRLTLHSNAVP
jgi:hypothetical protein